MGNIELAYQLGVFIGSPVFGQLEKRHVGKKACGKKAFVVLACRLLAVPLLAYRLLAVNKKGMYNFRGHPQMTFDLFTCFLDLLLYTPPILSCFGLLKSVKNRKLYL